MLYVRDSVRTYLIIFSHQAAPQENIRFREIERGRRPDTVSVARNGSRWNIKRIPRSCQKSCKMFIDVMQLGVVVGLGANSVCGVVY